MKKRASEVQVIVPALEVSVNLVNKLEELVVAIDVVYLNSSDIKVLDIKQGAFVLINLIHNESTSILCRIWSNKLCSKGTAVLHKIWSPNLHHIPKLREIRILSNTNRYLPPIQYA
jgi:hypothetical protein